MNDKYFEDAKKEDLEAQFRNLYMAAFANYLDDKTDEILDRIEKGEDPEKVMDEELKEIKKFNKDMIKAVKQMQDSNTHKHDVVSDTQEYKPHVMTEEDEKRFGSE